MAQEITTAFRQEIDPTGPSRLVENRREWFIHKHAELINRGLEPWMKMHEMEGDVKIDIGQDGLWESQTIVDDETIEQNVGMGFTLTPAASSIIIENGYEVGSVDEDLYRVAQVERAVYLEKYNRPEVISRIEKIQNDIDTNGPDSKIKKPLFLSFLERMKLHPWINQNGEQKAPLSELFKSDPHEIPGMGSFAYRTRYTPENSSRKKLTDEVIIDKIGKYARSPLTLAPMPHSAGSLDAISTAAMMHMLAVIPRNYQFLDVDFQASFAQSVLHTLDNFQMPVMPGETEKDYIDRTERTKTIWKRNVGAAIGVGNSDIDRFKKLYEVGIRSFRLYTVATDTHLKGQLKNMINTIKDLNDDTIEIFIGQMTTEDQFNDMFEDNVSEQLSKTEQLDKIIDEIGEEDFEKYVNGVYIGNGGGSVCSTATTGMIVNSVELVNRFRNHKKMHGKSIIVEGGMNSEPIPWLFGADGLSFASEMIGLERPGGKIVLKKKGKNSTIYAGEASKEAKRVEQQYDEAGQPIQEEGSIGIREITGSITRKIQRMNEYLAQVLVKAGVKTPEQLHALGTILTSDEMTEVYGENWRSIPDVYTVKPNKIAKFVRQITHQPKQEGWKEKVLSSLGIKRRGKKHYMIPHPIEHRSLQVRNEGVPYGAIGN